MPASRAHTYEPGDPVRVRPHHGFGSVRENTRLVVHHLDPRWSERLEVRTASSARIYRGRPAHYFERRET